MKRKAHTIPPLDGRELVLRTEAAAFEVRPSDACVMHTHRDMTVDVIESDTRVDVSFYATTRWFGGFSDVVLELPERSRLTVQVDYGPLRCTGLKDVTLNFETSSGAMDVIRGSGNYRCRTLAGAIKTEQLDGTFDFETSAGAMHLGIATLQPGMSHARTLVGAITVELAPGLDVFIDSSAGLGAVRNHYKVTQNAAAKMQLRADVGAVKVVELGKTHKKPPRNDQDLSRVLQRVAEGSLSVDEAERLLSRMDKAKKE